MPIHVAAASKSWLKKHVTTNCGRNISLDKMKQGFIRASGFISLFNSDKHSFVSKIAKLHSVSSQSCNCIQEDVK